MKAISFMYFKKEYPLNLKAIRSPQDLVGDLHQGKNKLGGHKLRKVSSFMMPFYGKHHLKNSTSPLKHVNQHVVWRSVQGAPSAENISLQKEQKCCEYAKTHSADKSSKDDVMDASTPEQTWLQPAAWTSDVYMPCWTIPSAKMFKTSKRNGNVPLIFVDENMFCLVHQCSFLISPSEVKVNHSHGCSEDRFPPWTLQSHSIKFLLLQ